MELFNICV